MSYLLAAHGRRVLRQDRSRRDQFYDAGQVFDKRECPILGLMHHLCGVTLVEVPLLGGGMVSATSRGPLVPAP